MHRRIERNPKASAEAKRVRGLACEVCGFKFIERYGELGDGYIEAHHLRPLSLLEEGVPVTYDPQADFAVLCANCHRMIHRMVDPSNIDGLRARVV